MTNCHLGIVVFALLFSGCTYEATESSETPEQKGPDLSTYAGPIEYAVVPDNVKHDTLLVQVTMDLEDGTYIMVASHVDEKFEGLRLYHYRSLPDSSAEILAVSAPAYDSWSMLPMFFGPGKSLNGSWMVANFGERESWGQKLFWCENDFQDRGFIDLAYPEHVVEQDTSYLKRKNIAPYIRVGSSGDTTMFHFACDSVYIYDDLKGQMNYVVPAASVRYTYLPGSGLVLWVNGIPRVPEPNA